MTGALNALRSSAVEVLRQAGVQAVTAMEPTPAKRWDAPVAAVSLSRVVCAPGGFQDYLGLRKNPDTGAQEELYGRGVEVTLGLDLYAPREGGEGACQEAVCRMAEALTSHSVGGLRVEEFRTGAVEFLDREGLYHLSASCLCRGWMVAAADSGGTFVDFELKGRSV